MTTPATICEPLALEATEPSRERGGRRRRAPPATGIPPLKDRALTARELLRAMLMPAVALAVLALCARIAGQPFDNAMRVLAILTFALSFPGHAPRRAGLGAIAAGVAADWLVVSGILLLVGWATDSFNAFDGRTLAAWALTTPFAAIAVEWFLVRYAAVLIAAAGRQRSAVIVGGGPLGRQLAQIIGSRPLSDIRIAGVFDDRALPRSGDILGPISRLAAYVREHRIDCIYITLPIVSQPRILALLRELRDTTASVYFTPDIFLPDLIQARVDHVDGLPVIAVCETPHYGINAPLKRASDLILGTLILLLILPVMLTIAMAIRLESPGPVIFRQRRYGLDGREIMVWKFRSMKVTEDGDTIRQATRDDDRVTRIGGFLRRTSLDELPQFINVLQGTMSIVGPRPHAVAHNELYRKLIDGYMLRHKVKPGITGWAQVNGLRGETDTLDKMQKRIDYDLAYLRDWSLWTDLLIILKTPRVAWKKQNAY